MAKQKPLRPIVHNSMVTGRTYTIGYVIKQPEGVKNIPSQFVNLDTIASLDMTVIMDMHHEEYAKAPEMIGWYFGEYDYILTERFIREAK